MSAQFSLYIRIEYYIIWKNIQNVRIYRRFSPLFFFLLLFFDERRLSVWPTCSLRGELRYRSSRARARDKRRFAREKFPIREIQRARFRGYDRELLIPPGGADRRRDSLILKAIPIPTVNACRWNRYRRVYSWMFKGAHRNVVLIRGDGIPTAAVTGPFAKRADEDAVHLRPARIARQGVPPQEIYRPFPKFE